MTIEKILECAVETVNDEISSEESIRHLRAMRKAKALTYVAATFGTPALLAAGVPIIAITAGGVAAGLSVCALFERLDKK